VRAALGSVAFVRRRALAVAPPCPRPCRRCVSYRDRCAPWL